MLNLKQELFVQVDDSQMKSIRTLLILLLFLPMIGNGATLYSRIAGNWNSGTTWSNTSGGSSCGCTPNPSSDIIYVETAVVLNINLTGGSKISGVLEIAMTGSLTSTTRDLRIATGGTLNVLGSLIVRNLQFDNGSIISVSSTGTINTKGDFDNKNNSIDVTIDGVLNVEGSFSNGTGAAIAGDGVILYDSSNFSNSGTISGYDDTTGTINLGGDPLPIELLSFTVNQFKDGEVTISWSTAVEMNSDYFEIERMDEYGNSEIVGTVKAAGNSTSKLEYFIINTPSTSGEYYYRLIQYDFDGVFEIFDWATITLTKSVGTDWFVYPNPVQSNQTLRISELEVNDTENSILTIINTQGRIILEASLEQSINQGISLPNDISSGIYWVKIFNGCQWQSKQIAIVN